MSKDNKISASKRSREGIQKRVISVAIKERLKDDQIAPPPSDSWAWRKYGQKPIKGSPYPRGYYKCSSSKGCPARKQVERSRVDPTTLLVTYYCQHNHTSPPSRNYHHRTAAASNSTTSVSEEDLEDEEEEEDQEKAINNVISSNHESSDQRLIPENRFADIGDGPLVNGGEFGWFADFESTSCTMLESPILTEDYRVTMDNEMALIFEEDESDLFADLGELPECSAVFRRGEVAQRRRSLATTTG